MPCVLPPRGLDDDDDDDKMSGRATTSFSAQDHAHFFIHSSLNHAFHRTM
jgi:hypothetical protein